MKTAAMKSMRRPVVHLLWNGRALCGREGDPALWPDHERISFDTREATCPTCLIAGKDTKAFVPRNLARMPYEIVTLHAGVTYGCALFSITTFGKGFPLWVVFYQAEDDQAHWGTLDLEEARKWLHARNLPVALCVELLGKAEVMKKEV
jgi:hypothetical protein